MISENPKRRMEEDVQTKKNTVTVKITLESEGIKAIYGGDIR